MAFAAPPQESLPSGAAAHPPGVSLRQVDNDPHHCASSSTSQLLCDNPVDHRKSVAYTKRTGAAELGRASLDVDEKGCLAVRTSHGSGAFDQIRLDILRCRLRPGSRLPLDELRERYQTGFSPLREALMRLEAEGLVVLEHNKGFRVSPVSEEHLLDLGKVRVETERIALGWAIERGDVAWEADLLSAFHRLSRQTKVDPTEPDLISEAWHTEHRRFHAALVAACDSKLLQSIHSALFDQAERYVALSVSYREQPRDDVAEHKALVDAALARDKETAWMLCTQHIERTTSKVLTHLRTRAAHREGSADIRARSAQGMDEKFS